MSEMKKTVLAVDGGGTYLKAALFRGTEMIEGSFMSVPAMSSGSAEEIAEAFRSIGQHARELANANGATVTAVGTGMPGPFDYRDGVLMMEHKFAAAKGLSIGPWLTEALGDIPVCFGHDAGVFLRGGIVLEGVTKKNVCGATIGTGLGFGSMKNGRLLLLDNGYPGISLWGRPYRESIVEDYISRRGVRRAFVQAGGAGDPDVYEISLLARRGDRAAVHAFDELGRNLGRVVAEVMAENGFETFLLGGAISKSADLFLPALEKELERLSVMPELRPVHDIDNAPLYGAAQMAEQYTAQYNT